MRADVARWFRARTYRGDDFTAADLVAAKHGRRVSVVLPARDERATVGEIVTRLRRDLVEQVPLLDEVVVIDSDSRDDTAAVARAAGAEVHAQSEVLPEVGHRPGKGEALWKSLAVTSGEVLVFVDADLRDFDPRLVVGLLGPVLTDGVSYVKACYDRPLATGERLLPAGGGRVTELVARPLLNAHWPELAGFVQPLAGEYAGTRAVLEQVPFVDGYGVEVGLLVDLLGLCGLDALAQVDVGARVHRNSSDEALARMALQIHLTVQRRLEQQGRIAVHERPSHVLTQFERDAGGHRAYQTEVQVGERPPMASLR